MKTYTHCVYGTVPGETTDPSQYPPALNDGLDQGKHVVILPQNPLLQQSMNS